MKKEDFPLFFWTGHFVATYLSQTKNQSVTIPQGGMGNSENSSNLLTKR